MGKTSGRQACCRNLWVAVEKIKGSTALLGLSFNGFVSFRITNSSVLISDLTIPLTTEPKSELSVNRMDGYLTFKESPKSWVRYYVVIQGSDLYYYHKKEVYIKFIFW